MLDCISLLMIRLNHIHFHIFECLKALGMGNATKVMSLGGDYDTTRAVGLKARMAKTKGVARVDFNYTNNKVTVEFDSEGASPKELEAMVSREKKHRAHSIASGIRTS